MDGKDCIGRNCGARFIRKMGRVVLFAMLPWNVYAAADRFPGAQMQLDGLVNAAALVDSPSAAVSFEAPAQEPMSDQAELIIPEDTSLDVNAGGEIPHSEVVDQELASLEVVDLQPAPIVPLDTASLEVVDTGTSRQVQKPQPAAVVSADTEASAALESEVNVSTSGEADELNTAAARIDDHQVKNYKVMLPMADLVEKNEMAGTVVAAAAARKNEPPEDASGGAASEEMIQLPYAVLLAILALISMVPVARRNG